MITAASVIEAGADGIAGYPRWCPRRYRGIARSLRQIVAEAKRRQAVRDAYSHIGHSQQV